MGEKESRAYVLSFAELGLEDIPKVGGKNASLGEMIRELQPKGLRIPQGFATTAQAYREFLVRGKLEGFIRETLAGLEVRDVEDLARRGAQVRDAMMKASLPEGLQAAILAAYRQLGETYGEAPDVAVRSSATAEDLPEASFAGQQETFLNIRGDAALLDACRRCYASLFTNRAISYRAERGFDHLQVALSVGVQKMVRSDLGASGVMFTLHTESGFRDVVLINAAYGLGENVVQGVVDPDEFLVFKTTLRAGFRPILQKRLGSKEIRMVYNPRGGTKETRNVPVPPAERGRFCLEDEEILQLARWGVAVEEHYSAKAGRYRPMDLEWARDGVSGELFLLQARPETVHGARETATWKSYVLLEKSVPLVEGRAVGTQIGAGRARLLRGPKEMASFQEGEILVATMTDPDWEPIMKKAAGVVTERGGRTCHAAIVSRELGVPAVVGADRATEKIPDGTDLTVSCAEGEVGRVYAGRLRYRTEDIALGKVPRPQTKVLLNVGEPDRAFEHSFLPNDGVGLARMEFIINDAIKVHPMALLRYPGLKDPEALRRIEDLTSAYPSKAEYFVSKLAEGIGKIAAAFYPKEVIVRTSDFKTNEYANLIGGREFEPQEENPMIGFRGASRYYHERYREAFALECAALRRVRADMGLKNLKVMIPFCRTIDEAQKVLGEMARHGLKRGEDGLQVYVMCEIPSNVLLAKEFAQCFDGFSIGSNDLTQLTLGLDRDSEIVSSLFDERNEAVKRMIRTVIRAAKEAGAKIGICGQAPSDYPEFAAFLVEEGIDSISLNPDSVVKTTLKILEAEGAREATSGAWESGD
ncbi:MAG: phosphoenolpyruvate synthase [bacterium]